MEYFCRYLSVEITDGIFPSVIRSVSTDGIKPSVITDRITDGKSELLKKGRVPEAEVFAGDFSDRITDGFKTYDPYG